MLRTLTLALALLPLLPAVVDAQTARRPAARAAQAAKPPAVKREPAKLTCPATLGTGVETRRTFCDVLTGRDPAEGVLVTIPAHSGEATLTFDLHNRHTYSEQQVQDGQAYAEYTATVGVLTMKNDLLSRAVVYSSFRTAADLLDRVEGGAGPGGVKAVAPTGTEPIAIKVPQDVTQVSVLGERLLTRRLVGEEVATSSGRPIAVISNVMVEYRPAPARRATTRRR
jgi:hypothetical protein